MTNLLPSLTKSSDRPTSYHSLFTPWHAPSNFCSSRYFCHASTKVQALRESTYPSENTNVSCSLFVFSFVLPCSILVTRDLTKRCLDISTTQPQAAGAMSASGFPGELPQSVHRRRDGDDWLNIWCDWLKLLQQQSNWVGPFSESFSPPECYSQCKSHFHHWKT